METNGNWMFFLRNVVILVIITAFGVVSGAHSEFEGWEEPDGSVSLRGDRPDEGAMLIWEDGVMGGICSDSWSMEEGRVACWSLGYDDVISIPSFPIESDTILFNDVRCQGYESDLSDCELTRWDPELHGPCGELAGVFCEGKQGGFLSPSGLRFEKMTNILYPVFGVIFTLTFILIAYKRWRHRHGSGGMDTQGPEVMNNPGMYVTGETGGTMTTMHQPPLSPRPGGAQFPTDNTGTQLYPQQPHMPLQQMTGAPYGQDNVQPFQEQNQQFPTPNPPQMTGAPYGQDNVQPFEEQNQQFPPPRPPTSDLYGVQGNQLTVVEGPSGTPPVVHVNPGHGGMPSSLGMHHPMPYPANQGNPSATPYYDNQPGSNDLPPPPGYDDATNRPI